MNQREKKQYETDREIERLRWKCLVRNKDFQEWWSWYQEVKRDPSTPRPQTETFKNRTDAQGREFSPRMVSIAIHYIYIFVTEDNLNDDAFDKYWDYLQEWRASEKYKSSSVPKSVENYRDIISKDIDSVVNYFKREENREPTITELKDNLISWMITYRLYLMITQREFTYQEADAITKQISILLKKRVPKKHFVKEEIERYLKVYDLRNKGLKWKNICAEIYPDEVFNEKIRLSLLSDKKKAEKMIKNVENRLFLGKRF